MSTYHFRTELLGFSRDDVTDYLRNQGKKLRNQTAELEVLRATGNQEEFAKLQIEFEELQIGNERLADEVIRLKTDNDELSAIVKRLSAELAAVTLSRDKLAARLKSAADLLSEENDET
ncbi:MAG: hypothetical protein LBN97_01225 [Oscillospiraceae bacterium]|jgi:septal ring factor EnvC (AmiA/AmiB activator)|nr:hypothetical protein [Oscillospiraceae bacterium]